MRRDSDPSIQRIARSASSPTATSSAAWWRWEKPDGVYRRDLHVGSVVTVPTDAPLEEVIAAMKGIRSGVCRSSTTGMLYRHHRSCRCLPGRDRSAKSGARARGLGGHGPHTINDESDGDSPTRRSRLPPSRRHGHASWRLAAAVAATDHVRLEVTLTPARARASPRPRARFSFT